MKFGLHETLETVLYIYINIAMLLWLIQLLWLKSRTILNICFDIQYNPVWWYILFDLNKMSNTYFSCSDWKTWVCKLEHYQSTGKDIHLYTIPSQTYIKYFRHHGTQQYNFLHTMTAYITYKITPSSPFSSSLHIYKFLSSVVYCMS